MHETSLAMKIVAAGLGEAGRRGLQRVRTLHLRLGVLWGVEWESLEVPVALAARGTLLENAKVKLEMVPAHARCRSCGAEVKDPRLREPGFLHNLAHGAVLLEALLHCSRCEASSVEIEQGRELEVVEVES